MYSSWMIKITNIKSYFFYTEFSNIYYKIIYFWKQIITLYQCFSNIKKITIYTRFIKDSDSINLFFSIITIKYGKCQIWVQECQVKFSKSEQCAKFNSVGCWS